MNSEIGVYRRQKIYILIGLTLFWFVATLANILIAPTGGAWAVLFLLTGIGWGFGILAWCRADAEERGSELSGVEKIAIVALGILALIWYLFQTRGANGGFKALGWLVLYAVSGFVVLTIVTTVILVVLHIAGIRPIT